MEAPTQQPYSFGPFVLDPVEKRLLRDGNPLALPPKALETLLALVEHRGHVMEKGELLERVWPDTFVEEATLTQNIFTLRKALGDSPNGHEYIETVPKRGYRFVAAVKAMQGQEVSTAARPATLRAMPQRRLLWIAVPFLVATVSLGIYLRGRAHRPVTSPALGKVMLAVLPFENFSGDPMQEYFSDGLTEEMISQLSRVNPERLGVIARTSAMQYKSTTKSASQIGHELGVDYVLESSIRREGDRVRITTQLVRVSDQTHLWSQSYDRDAHEILPLESEVAQAIAQEIEINLSPKEEARLAGGRAVDPEAYELYLKGRYEWNKRSQEGLKRGLEYFQQAINLEPTYALAYSGVADSYLALSSNGFLPGTEGDPKAKAAALKALELDETSAQAHTSLAQVLFDYSRDPEAALREFQAAIKLNPNYPLAHFWYSSRLAEMGRHEEAVREIEHARRLDPLSSRVNAGIAYVFYLGREYDRAIAEARKALELEPNDYLAHEMLASAYIEKGMSKEAVAESQKRQSMVPPDPEALAGLACSYAAAGNREEALRILGKLRLQSKVKYISPFYIAEAYVGVGEKEEALAWLQKGLDLYDGNMGQLKVAPALDPLRSDPRFADLVRRIGLPP